LKKELVERDGFVIQQIGKKNYNKKTKKKIVIRRRNKGNVSSKQEN
jgi:hypothetical protein